MLLFAIAGVFSSEVTKAAGNSTLIRSSKCGFLAPKLSDPNSFAGYNALDTNGTLAASTYSRACYGNAHNELQCNQYVKPHLSWTAKRNATCPFEGDLCFGGPTGSYEMDTGLIDSHDHLGINAKKSDRIQYRKITTCSVLNSTGRYDEVNKTVGGNPKTYFRLHFGQSSSKHSISSETCGLCSNQNVYEILGIQRDLLGRALLVDFTRMQCSFYSGFRQGQGQ